MDSIITSIGPQERKSMEAAAMASPFYALFGTGDWSPWADEVFKLVPGNGHVGIVAAGQVENGPSAIEEYRQGAAERFARIGIPVVQVPLLTRNDADSSEALASLDRAAFIYVLGGGPTSTIEALRGSRFWAAMMGRSIPYVGSSGGSMLLGARCPRTFTEFGPGLGHFPNVVIAAHWDELETMQAGLQETFTKEARNHTLLGLDVDAGIVGDGSKWSVYGPRGVHIRYNGRWTHYWHGDQFSLNLRADSSGR